ncbi:MAG: TlpA family protein disulfide reductase [Paludibacteraceae bacterium]|nr:TlpA family protein disulfide reductase [Paludibacteraceae bacterium]
MENFRFLYILVAAVVLSACGREQKPLKQQFHEMDSALTEQYREAAEAEDQAAMDSIEALYYAQLFELVTQNPEDEWEDSLLLMTFRQFTPEQKDSILSLLSPAMLQGEIMQALVSKYETEKATSVGHDYVDIMGVQPDGTELKLSELVGKTDYVLLDFWATWCGPCCRLLPRLKALYDSLPEGRLEVLGVNCDDNKDAWRKKIEEDQLRWRHITTGESKQNDAYNAYGVEGIPTTILIDREGKIVHRSYGEEEEIRKIVAGR